MHTPSPTVEPRSAEDIRIAALERLQQESNPFTFSVATAGTEDNCLVFDVPELLDTQRSALRAIVNLYREGNSPSQAYPILGDPGTGKTHLRTTFQAELDREARERGTETMVVSADHFSVGLDPIDFFLWQIVNHLLSQSGQGARMLRSLADRVTGRLLGEALRQTPPQQQIALIPATGFWERMGLQFGRVSLVQSRLESIRSLLARCDQNPPTDLGAACQAAGVSTTAAASLIRAHLERTEPKNVAGYYRQELFHRLALLSLNGERDPIEGFLTVEYRQGPEFVTGAGQPSRRLLTTFLELFRELRIPVVLIFDQIEDFLIGSAREVKHDLRDAFSQALAALVNNVPGLCLLIFAERSLWNGTILQRIPPYALERLDRDFSLPGQPSRRYLEMPTAISRSHLTQVIQRRVRKALKDFDPTGLPASFPFGDGHLSRAIGEPTVRQCLRKLSEWYNEIVFPVPEKVNVLPEPTSKHQKGEIKPADQPPPTSTQPDPLVTRLKSEWESQLAGARRWIEQGQPSAVLIPQIQIEMDVWLTFLREQGITAGMTWARVELLTDANKGPFGYLNVIRFDDPDSPGVGIAAWMAQKVWRPTDLERRLEFFDLSPCPIRTLVMFREDGEDALTGRSREIYDHAISRGRDVRIQPYEPRQLAAVIAFSRWLQAVRPELDNRTTGQAALRAFVERLSIDLLRWIQGWRAPGGSQ